VKIGLMWVAPTPPDILVTLARNAEAAGAEYLAVHDHLEPYCRDVWVNMTLLLTNTESATVGTNVVNPFTMHPVNCARAVAHLEEIAPGRTFLGWAPGHVIGIPSLGIPYKHPLARTREAVRLSKQLLSGAIPPNMGPPVPDEYQINFNGDFFQFTHNYVLPSRKVPVSVASGSPKMLEMGAEEADGVYVGHYGRREAMEWCLDHVEIGARRAGKTLDELTIYQGFWLSVWPDRAVAVDAVARLASAGAIASMPFRKHFDIKLPFEKYIGEAMEPGTNAYNTWVGQTTYQAKPEFLAQIPDEVRRWMAIAGTPDDCIEQLRDAIDPRADVVYIVFFAPQPWAVEGDPWRQPYLEMGRLFNREVLPELQRITAEYTARREGTGRKPQAAGTSFVQEP
jgi:5,10-methylenetetrahydromethanopterin reductase